MSLPSPLHPLIVHLPIALTVLVPLFVIGALWAIRRGVRAERAWAFAVSMLALLFASGLMAKVTGEREEEKVEEVVRETAIGTHEEAADLFVMVSGVVLLIGGAGFLRGRIGAVGRGVAAVGTLAVLAAGVNVGRSGGKLVYEEGAAMAYTSPPSPGGESRERPSREGGGERDGDGR